MSTATAKSEATGNWDDDFAGFASVAQDNSQTP